MSTTALISRTLPSLESPPIRIRVGLRACVLQAGYLCLGSSYPGSNLLLLLEKPLHPRVVRQLCFPARLFLCDPILSRLRSSVLLLLPLLMLLPNVLLDFLPMIRQKLMLLFQRCILLLKLLIPLSQSPGDLLFRPSLRVDIELTTLSRYVCHCLEVGAVSH